MKNRRQDGAFFEASYLSEIEGSRLTYMIRENNLFGEGQAGEPINLNDLAIEDDGSFLPVRNVQDSSTSSSDRTVTVYFRELERHLIHHIAKSRLVVGCVAWLTSESILRALAEVPDGVAIVVQKEDFLQPDLGSRGDWKVELRHKYDALRETPQRHLWGWARWVAISWR